MTSKKNIVIFTSRFPYHPGEQFLEKEIEYWSGLGWANVSLFPSDTGGEPRVVPDDIFTYTSSRTTRLRKLIFLPKAMCSAYFLREIIHLYKARKLHVGNIKAALYSVINVYNYERRIRKSIGQIIDVAYTYWNSEVTYALCRLKSAGLVKSVISRAHGYDLYEYRREGVYIPLKRQFAADMDLVCPISDQGKKYLIDTYGFSAQKVNVYRLGVSLPAAERNVEPDYTDIYDDSLSMVSVSFCLKVKNIDKIIDAIAFVAQKYSERKFKWIHIGGGRLMQNLVSYAKNKLGPLSNVSYQFLGHIDNRLIYEFYIKTPVDFIINCSSSEGIPVSLMEAMANGVPAIAPDIGGISELIDNESGILMSAEPDIKEIADSINAIKNNKNRVVMENAARLMIAEKYNADMNYKEFVNMVYMMSDLNASPV